MLTKTQKTIAWVIFISVTAASFIFIDKTDPFDDKAFTVQKLTIAQRAHRWAVAEYADTHAGRNHARPANYYKPYTASLKHHVIRAYRNQVWNRQVKQGKRCCDFDLPTPGEVWDGFVEGAGDGLMCAMYDADSSLEAAGCAAETAGRGVKWALADPTEVLMKATVGCVEDAAIGAGAAATYVAGALVVRRQVRISSTVWKNRWVIIENNVGRIPKGLYVCWAATYAKHVLTGP